MGGRHSNKPSLHDVRQHAAGDQGRPGRISFFKQTQRMTTPPLEASGGARRDRTDDLLLAKQALSQLSYGPGMRRSVVGPGRVELPTSRLSGVRSNHLSYGPPIPGQEVRRPECPIAHDPVKSGPITSARITSVCVREERETKTAASRQIGP